MLNILVQDLVFFLIRVDLLGIVSVCAAVRSG